MKIQRHKFFGFFLISAIAVSFGVALADIDTDFGKTITTVQMENMFGGGWVDCGDRDCDTTSGSCPGGSTCDGETGGACWQCKSGAGQTCGQPGGSGWQCVSETESCNETKGMCVDGNCEKNINATPGGSCGTRPDC